VSTRFGAAHSSPLRVASDRTSFMGVSGAIRHLTPSRSRSKHEYRTSHLSVLHYMLRHLARSISCSPAEMPMPVARAIQHNACEMAMCAEWSINGNARAQEAGARPAGRIAAVADLIQRATTGVSSARARWPRGRTLMCLRL
jgi:hypothetical protein